MTENDHEHKSFEKFALQNNLDRSMHPLHLLYLEEQTAKALKAFKAGYEAGKDFTLLAPTEIVEDCYSEEEWKGETAKLFMQQCGASRDEAINFAQAAYDNIGGDIEFVSPQYCVNAEMQSD